MAKRQRLTLQVLDETFINPLSKDEEEDHHEEEYCDSTEYSPELDEEIPNKVTDTRIRKEPVRSASNQSFGFRRTGRAGFRGGCGSIPCSFTLFLCLFVCFF